MPGEIPPNQSDPNEPDDNKRADAEANNINDHYETLQQGAKQLTEAIIKIEAMENPKAVKDYLDAILDDTEKLVPVAERMFAFEFLAGEQRSKIQGDLFRSGEKMIDNLSNNNQKINQEFKQTSPQATQGIRQMRNAHEQEVGRYLRGQVDARRVTQGQEVAAQTARKGFNAVKMNLAPFSSWARSQQEMVNVFDSQIYQGQAHERALNEASESVNPNYEGEQKELSQLIDEDVKEAASLKLRSTITEAQTLGKSPEDVLLELIKQQESGVILPKINQKVRTFAEQYAQSVKIGRLKVENYIQESEHFLKNFIARGSDGYMTERRVDQATDLYRRQKRTLEEVSENIESAIRQSSKVIIESDQELQRMQHKLLAVKDINSPKV